MEKQKTILIVDDAAINRMILDDVLSERFQTLQAENGEEAISLLEHNNTEISLVLLDIYMPKKNGYDVLQFMQLHNLLECIPVIVVTGNVDNEGELKAYNLGASDVIHKPFVPQIVQRRIENLLELYDRRMHLEQQLEESRRVLVDVQFYDNLTALLTKQRFIHEVSKRQKIADADGSYAHYSMVYYNIRNFKMYNVNYGTDAGDQVLKYLATIIKSNGMPEDFHARFGNDHFVSLTGIQDLEEFCSTLITAFDEKFGSYGMKLKIGVYRISRPGLEISINGDYAKIACDSIYSATEGYCIYTKEIQKKVDTSAYIIQHFEEALQNGYIKVYYQPVMRTLTGKLCSMEALARWIDPVMGFLSPGEFIPVLEENHLITKLDLHMLRLICKEMFDRRAAQRIVVPVSFNLSRMDFVACDIFEEVERIVKEYRVARDLIHIEITESLFTDRPDFIRSMIERFRSVGYQVWMDDFGSGYSSLNVLKDFTFDEIKLDMKFLTSFDENSKKIIEAVIGMAKRMGIHTLAEGVETREQYAYLRSIGCEKAQGYLFSKPRPWVDLVDQGDHDHIDVERRAEHLYYDDAENINLLTDRAVAVVEYNGRNFRHLYITPRYRKVNKMLGVTDMETLDHVTNSQS